MHGIVHLLLFASWFLPPSNAVKGSPSPPSTIDTFQQREPSLSSGTIHSSSSSSGTDDSPFGSRSSCAFNHFHPRRYAAYHLHSLNQSGVPSISIDGLLDEPAWTQVPWSEEFQDIRGPTFWSQPWFTTKFKLRYDQQFLYIGVYVEETEVWAKASHDNDVIFQDNDFEVFVDADGSTHNYKEVELNARNATWNLWLNRPYRDGGHENSTRVDPQHGFDMLSSGMRSAVYVKGPINDPAERLHYWSAELALPLSELARYSQAKVPPVSTSFWRINFSRVEWPVRVVSDRDTGKQVYEKESGLSEENWTWSAQFAVDMHRPEWWGYLYFRPRHESPPVTEDSNETVPLDPEWGVRYVSFQYYYAQHAFYDATGTYASRLEQLLPFYASREAILCTNVVDVSASEKSFHARIRLRGHAGASEFVARIDENGYIFIENSSSSVSIAAVE